MGYSEGLDRASPAAFEWDEQGLIDELWREADAASVGLERDELAGVLLSIGLKHNYGLAPETAATPAQMGSFWRGLHLKDLALAHACAFGRDAAWRQFMARFRDALTHSAISITGSAAMGEELAASLYAELFGLTERGEQRRSPLAYYSGRGSLKGFLRATLAQRNVDQIRRTSREMPITHDQVATVSPSPTPPPMVLGRLAKALAAILGSLPSEERFLLSAWYLDRHTLLDISHILRVHEATVSRSGLAYQVAGQYFIPWTTKPADEPLTIDVNYDRTRLTQGDIVSATATIKSHLKTTANMVMVELGIPPRLRSAQRRSRRLPRQNSGAQERPPREVQSHTNAGHSLLRFDRARRYGKPSIPPSREVSYTR